MDAEEGSILSEVVNIQLEYSCVVSLRNGYHEDNVIDFSITTLKNNYVLDCYLRKENIIKLGFSSHLKLETFPNCSRKMKPV